MLDITRKPDGMMITCDGDNTDTVVRTELSDGKLYVYVKADKSRPKYITLRWNHRFDSPVRIMGDKWERSYGDMEWHALNGEIFMPWYFLIAGETETTGCGVMVQPNSFVSWQCDPSGITAWFDIRNGGSGIALEGRELLAGVVVCESYKEITPFAAAKAFCKVMSPNPILPKEPVYGSNNWYYAYGNSSYDEMMTDTDIIVKLAGENENKPFMVIDDGWSVNSCDGPWRANERYGDMKKTADDIRTKGARPGIWFRPLHDSELEEAHPEWRLRIGDGLWYLDPTRAEVKEYLIHTLHDIKSWGYELIKHDFSTYDMFGFYGNNLNGTICPHDNLQFYDKTKTNAEIVLEFYRLIRKEAGDMLIIGCNTISHLCAGLVEIYRIGDDTSGREWSRTRAYGVNTLAFRLCQNDAFYKVDADCVGLLEDNIPWKLNRQWLDLLARSGSPLFVSIQPKTLTEENTKDLKLAFQRNSVQDDIAEPLDWLYCNQPQNWMINGEKVSYDFVMDQYPVLLKAKIQPY